MLLEITLNVKTMVKPSELLFYSYHNLIFNYSHSYVFVIKINGTKCIVAFFTNNWIVVYNYNIPNTNIVLYRYNLNLELTTISWNA